VTALATVVIGRSSLSLSDLTIDSEGFGTYLVDAAGLGRVGITPRETFATAPPWLNGRLRTQVVKDESVLSLVVRVQSSSASNLDAAVAALEDALWQRSYPVTQTVLGVAKTYTAYPATLQSTDALMAFERVTAFYEDLSISIPVYPVAS
jgi:hypothetical protein